MKTITSNKKFVGKIIISLLLFLIVVQAQGQFITTWKTDNNGTSNDNQITIPTTGAGYDYTVNWGDGNTDNNVTGSITHTYATPGTYTVTISNNFPRIYFNNGGDKEKMLTVEQWGNIAWTSMASAFWGCANLTIPASDAPDLSGVIDMSNMFRDCSVFNDNINGWTVSTIENMSGLFRDATLFNQPLNSWAVNNVKDMSYMFFFAESFNQPIGTWKTDNVTTMRAMFGVAKAFNQSIDTDFFNGYWITSAVTDMNQMFSVAESFNQSISNWDVSNVTDFGGMFNGALAFNQSIASWPIGTTSNISMNSMFANATSFNQPLEWDVSKVTTMESMFAGATAFNQGLSGWNTFVSNVTNMSYMFSGTTYNQDISGWDVSSVTDFNGMFSGNTAFNQDISVWTINNVSFFIDMRNMFAGATAFNQNLGGWNITGLRYAANMFNNSGLTIENYDNLLIGWAGQTIQASVSFGAVGLYYCAANLEHASLITNGWFITDEGQGCIKVYEGSGLSGPEITNGQLTPMDFGSAQSGVGKNRTITIENRLSTSISINDVSLVLINAYSVTSPGFPAVIPAGGTQVAIINFDNVSPDTYDNDISIIGDDLHGTFDFPITGVITTTAQPEIKVYEGPNPFGTEIADGDVAGYYVGYENRGTDAVNQVTLLNNGSQDLVVTGITFTGTAFSANPTSFTVPVDGSQTVDITLSGSAGGDFSETMNIANDDTDENPFDFTVVGTISGPEIVVIDGTNYYGDPHISNGQPDPLDLGTSTLGSNVTRQISITNDGPVDLTVTDISFSGTSYSHTATLPFTVPATVDGIYTYVTFDVILDGSIAGTLTETVTITSDDDTDLSFVFDITGDISDPNAPKVYWSDSDEINRSNLDGSAFEQYHTEPTYIPRGIAIDTANNIAYWTNEWGQIKKGNIDVTGFSGVVDFINDGVDMARELNGVALDLTANKIYWASTFDGAIKSADLTDPDPISTVQTIVSGLANPIGVAVDPAGKIYYTENDNGGGATDNTATLHQVNFDGTNDVVLSTTLLTGEQYTYRDVKLDVSNNMVYWSGANDDIYSPIGEIFYANISDVSGTLTSFNTLNNSPLGIDLDLTNNKIYWTDELVYFVEPKIGMADLDGGNTKILQNGFNDGINTPLFIALDVAVISVCSNPPTANAGIDQTACENSTVSLSGSFGGSATSITWTTGGDGLFDDNASASAIYTLGANDVTNGSVTLTLTTDDPDGTGPCVAATDNLLITIEPLPTANAGVDQTLCPSDAATLNATIGGSATGGNWSTSGDGTFDNATSLTAIYTPGSTDITNGSVTLTLSTNSPTCTSVADNLVIDFNQPITAINQSGTLKVDETITLNLLNGATINTGDVITASVSVDPQKGTVTVNADGTADYTASQGNVGADSFDFQICNQCNLCSTATANITIANDAPTFNGTTTSATPGTQVSIDLTGLIADVNGNIDLSSITIIQQPNSGAVATLDANNNLIVDYTGIIFFGTDEVVIEVCDFDGACTNATILIEVGAEPIVAFNAVSPNSDGRHDFLEFQFIEAYPDNEVKILNRWGDVVFSIEGYNNQDKIFEGKSNKGGSNDLPTGTYYYTVFYKDVNGTSQSVKGFFELRR